MGILYGNGTASINDMLATSFGGIELGEITYRLSDLFIDNRSHGAERVGREILSGLISPMRAINRIITGEAWRHSSSKGRVYTSVPVNFIVGVVLASLPSRKAPSMALRACTYPSGWIMEILSMMISIRPMNGFS